MRIHGLCVVKNESDILRQGLLAARAWCDAIYVLDNGSTDGTWEQVQELAHRDSGIIPWKQEAVPFYDGLRADIFHAFASRARPGDWWARVDPDEFYVDDPRVFLTQVPSHAGCVWYASLSYYFSTNEALRYHADPRQFADEVPITDKCRHYFNHWSEIRFVRHEVMEPWEGVSGWPEQVRTRVRSYQRRILCRHFAYRSPAQIERRIATRAASALSGTVFSHEAIKDWRKVVDPSSIQQHRWQGVQYVTDATQMEYGWESRVIDAEQLVFDAHDGHFVLNENLMPPIPGVWRLLQQRLTSNRFTRTVKRVVKRRLQRQSSQSALKNDNNH